MARFPVVGIGASAGGLPALQALLEALPSDTGMAFVIVQHLSPDHASVLPALLALRTSMPVLEAREGLALTPDHVYVGPPGVRLTLERNTLHLGKTRSTQGPPRLIDEFLGSLAQSAPGRAIGVILSGSGTDGARGLRAIRSAGGTTFAQEPASANFDGMPRAAIDAGGVEHVLPAEGIAAALARLAHGPQAPFTPPLPPSFSSDGSGQDLSRVFHLLRTRTGVDFTHYKSSTIHRRLGQRMRLRRTDRLADYARYLEEYPEECEALGQDLLIHVTSFFRDPESFEAVKQHVFPESFRDRDPSSPFRLWVPGCSTGEEVYSLLICLLEYLGEDVATTSIQAFGTDLSEPALAQARAAFYPESIAADVSPERLRRFFVRGEGGYRIHKSLRDLCIFARQNVVGDPPFSRMDLISCRNVLIYLDPVLQKKVLPIFHYALNPGGCLLLGSAETVGASVDLFSLVDRRNKLYRKKSISYRPHLSFTYREPVTERREDTPLPSRRGAAEQDPQREADRLVLASYGPPGVIINDALEILHFRGHTGPYLEPLAGAASLNLLKMAREGLALELRAAIRQVQRGTSRVRKEQVRVSGREGERRINLEVNLLQASSDNREHYYLVLFEEAPVPPASTAPRGARVQEVRGQRAATRQELESLREELRTTRQHLQTLLQEQESTSEQLRAAHEEAQSSNEELQSTNEELETAKEELQSTNEELTTLNEELQNRNLELSQLNSDLNNLLGSTQIATIMLGDDLRIRRFTPMAQEVLGLSAGDMGRSLLDLPVPLELTDLERAVSQVTRQLTPFEREVRARDGHWYSLRLRPYKTLDNKLDGVVMTLLDVDRLKHSLEDAHQAREYAEALVETMREPFLVLDGHLRVLTANPAFYEAFQVTEARTLGQLVYQLGNGQWDIPQLRLLLEEVLPRNARLRDFVVEHDFDQIGHRRMLLNARRSSGRELGTQRILLSISDVTEQT
ncbi:Chemotaxis protein methyltransferase CheR [Cystobacter fuscus DSM 2262]|uniref:protein-glutamate O-methyltransferase n=1 Tax=Cystobacter fuscus (strain ATCC 25194 / DSM 2262 / NBRC 100088 / M29) TaxID=1242864 RepID=S9PJ18_CYSF2|nr:chemotaxis protein CheB [Cystobacter fuscus]EPX64300.1 Chemotaxis protein methyltransferase CheR [Cystobacter fuscus DSM 2262]